MRRNIKLYMNVLDLFAGAGGMSLGLEKSGHNIITGVDVWDDALKTYRYNNPSVGIKKDLHKQNPESIPVSKNQVEVVAGGPPCKGFSLSGDRNENDKRNKLIKRFIEYVDYYEPNEVIMENVTGILSMDTDNGESVVEYIHRNFEDLGYNSENKTLAADNFGVYQSRKRVFFRASKSEIEWPDKITKPSDLPVREILDQKFEKFENHNITNHKKSTIEKMAKLDYCESVYDYGEAWKRLNPNKPSITIKENHGAPFVHPYKNRVGTPRECAAIQSFPNEYKFIGTKSSVLKQIGNAVPPKLSEAVGKTL